MRQSKLFTVISTISIFIVLSPVFAFAQVLNWVDWKDFNAVSINVTAAYQVRHAKAFGYKYIGINDSYASWHSLSNLQGLHVYMDTPLNDQNVIGYFGDYVTTLNTAGGYSAPDEAWYESHFCMGGEAGTFPDNAATGWWTDATHFLGRWNVQIQSVTDELIVNTLKTAHDYQQLHKGVRFAGIINDVPHLTGDFNTWDGSKNVATTLNNWTGTDSAHEMPGTTHNWGNYAEAIAAWRKQSSNEIKKSFPEMHMVHEPAAIYHATNANEYLYKVGTSWITTSAPRGDRGEYGIHVDMYVAEGSPPTSNFTNSNIYSISGMPIDKSMIGYSGGNEADKADIVTTCVALAANGNYANRYLRYGGGGNKPTMDVDDETYWDKVMRLVANGDNRYKIDLTARSTIGTTVYNSPNSHIDNDVCWTESPHRKGQVFACFMSTGTPPPGSITVSSTKKITRIWQMNFYGEPDTDVTSLYTIGGDGYSTGTANHVAPTSGVTGSSDGIGLILQYVEDGKPARCLIMGNNPNNTITAL